MESRGFRQLGGSWTLRRAQRRRGLWRIREGSRLGDTHYKSNLQLAEDISGYFVERNRVYPGL